VAQVLGGLFDKQLGFDDRAPEPWTRHEPMTCAIYADDNGKAAALMLCDVGLAAYAGAALVLLPPTKAAPCAEGGYIDDELLENFHEVANVASALFNADGAPRVHLRELLSPPVDFPLDVRPLLVAPFARLHLDLNIEGYGKGRVVLLAA